MQTISRKPKVSRGAIAVAVICSARNRSDSLLRSKTIATRAASACFELGAQRLVALATHEGIGGILSGLDARLTEGIDVQQRARHHGLELVHEEELTHDRGVDCRNRDREIRA